jgi:hypothetical protein
MVEVIDNFLNESDFKSTLEGIVFNPSFQWFLNRGVTTNDIIESNYNHFAFYHSFYSNERHNENHEHNIGETDSEFIYLIKPMTEKLNMKALLRSKVNLYYKTDKRVDHNDHVDMPFSHKGALLNLNTNNGGTVIDGKAYKSVANQILLFDTSKPHHSFTQTDVELRFNMIVNYL